MIASFARRARRAAAAAVLTILAALAVRTAATAETATAETATANPATAAGSAAPGLAQTVRMTALAEAEAAHAMEAGLAWRAGRINAALEARAAALDSIWDFRALMTRVPGAVIAPPVLRRISGAMRIADPPPPAGGGDPGAGPGAPAAAAAATLRQGWRILEPARIVPRTPHWRDFLIRQWPQPDPLPDILAPRTDAERETVAAARRDGWRAGVDLAETIHDEDIDRLAQTWLGMAEWRRLVQAGMAAPPQLRRDRTAVAGGGDVLRLDETLTAIAIPGRLNPVTADWRPLERRSPAPDGQETAR